MARVSGWLRNLGAADLHRWKSSCAPRARPAPWEERQKTSATTLNAFNRQPKVSARNERCAEIVKATILKRLRELHRLRSMQPALGLFHFAHPRVALAEFVQPWAGR